MNRKSIVLMAGAVAAGLQAVSQKTTNPNMTALLVFAGVALAFFANPPRDSGTRERADDPVPEPEAKTALVGQSPSTTT